MAKQADPSERKQQIMDTFIRCLQKKSYFETTIRDIAKEAGVAPGLIYYYFESKEELLLAVFHQAMEHCLVTVDKYFDSLSNQNIHSEEFEQVLVNFLVEYYGGQGWEDCASFNALWALAQYNKSLKQAMHDSYVEFEAELRRLIASHLPPEVDASLLTRLLIIMLDGTVIFSTIYQSDLQDRVDFIQYAVKIMVQSEYLKHPAGPLPRIPIS